MVPLSWSTSVTSLSYAIAMGGKGAEVAGGANSNPKWKPVGHSWEMADENFNKENKQIGKDLQMDKNRQKRQK